MTEIKLPVTISKVRSGDGWCYRIPLPVKFTDDIPWLTPENRDVNLTGTADDKKIVIILEPKEG